MTRASEFEALRASDWFETLQEFQRVCGDAQSLSKSESAQEFAAQMVIRCKEYGLQTYLTPKQLNFLCQLADCVPPNRISNSRRL